MVKLNNIYTGEYNYYSVVEPSWEKVLEGVSLSRLTTGLYYYVFDDVPELSNETVRGQENKLSITNLPKSTTHRKNLKIGNIVKNSSCTPGNVTMVDQTAWGYMVLTTPDPNSEYLWKGDLYVSRSKFIRHEPTEKVGVLGSNKKYPEGYIYDNRYYLIFERSRIKII